MQYDPLAETQKNETTALVPTQPVSGLATFVLDSGVLDSSVPDSGVSVFGETGRPAVSVTRSKGDDFYYGWCLTDHKNGKDIRPDRRTIDYLNDEPYAGRVKSMLGRLGLPLPKNEEIFRGTNHDLLFLNSHGLVLRIGPTNVHDLMTPAILQPIGWIEDRQTMLQTKTMELPLTIALYPGIELYTDYLKSTDPSKPRLIGSLDGFLQATGHQADDLSPYNIGVIRVVDERGRQMAAPVLLDADNRFNGIVSGYQRNQRRDLWRILEEKSAQAGLSSNVADVQHNFLKSAFNETARARYWIRAYEAHQPLRQKFWDAFGDENKVDPEQRQAFWRQCAAVTNNPAQMMLPAWTYRKDDADNAVFLRQEIAVPQVLLMRPWTKLEPDTRTFPIEQTAVFKRAVAHAHRERVGLVYDAVQRRTQLRAPK
jgi:hypothetical protein